MVVERIDRDKIATHQCVQALEWLDQFSRSSNSMSEGLEEVPQRIQEDRFSSQDFTSSMGTGLNRRHRRHNNAAEQQSSASSG